MSSAIACMRSTSSSSAAACGLSKMASNGAEYVLDDPRPQGPDGIRICLAHFGIGTGIGP